VDEIAKFLLGAFQLEADAPFVDPKLLSWKYFGAHPDWNGPRSYIFRHGSRIVAHGCAYPVSFHTPHGEVSSLRVIDWAADRSSPGAGVILMKKLGTMVQSVLAVGGSDQTLKLLPGMGFSLAGTLDYYARVVRPFRQLRTTGDVNWKSPLRLARNMMWSLRANGRRDPDWSVEPVSRLDDRAAALLTRRTGNHNIIGKRTLPTLNYLLQCPAVGSSAFLLVQGGVVHGYFLLSHVRGQTRIADLWIDSEMPENWETAYALAVSTAADDKRCCEVAAAVSTDPARSALETNGFMLRRRAPIYLLDSQRKLDNAPLSLTLLDGDEWFLSDSGAPYWT
jgi:hypothetical protein